MSEPFKVPEPSEAATEAYWREREGQARINVMLHAAYAVDVPAIVRAEVERFREWQQSVSLNGVVESSEEDDYLAARFPEATPVPSASGGVLLGLPSNPTPRAVAAARRVVEEAK